MTDERKSGSQIEGEGSYEGSKKFQKAQQEFASGGKVDEKAKEAADAVDGTEVAELEKARRKSAEGTGVVRPLARGAPSSRTMQTLTAPERTTDTHEPRGDSC